MQVGVAYSENAQHVWMTIELAEGATVADAIAASRFSNASRRSTSTCRRPESSARSSSSAHLCAPATASGIYRAITCDPQSVPRRDGD